MFTSFAEIYDYVKAQNIKKRVGIVAAADEDVITSIMAAHDKGIVEPVFVGDEPKIKEILTAKGYNPGEFKIVHQTNDALAAQYVAEKICSGEIDIPMKGLIQTSQFMRAILNKELGLVPNKGLISQATVFQWPKKNKLMVAGDCAINIAPELDDKVKIVQNTIKLAKKLQYDLPKVAMLAPVEVVNPKIVATSDAAIISKMNERNQIKGAIIDGPLAFDLAMSEVACEHKGVRTKVQGDADVLIMPDLNAGNIFHKTLSYVAGLETAGTVLGAKCPIIATSRADSANDKFNAIMIGILLAS